MPFFCVFWALELPEEAWLLSPFERAPRRVAPQHGHLAGQIFGLSL